MHFCGVYSNNGEGPHPVSDACDYARFVLNDFWVLDHAEAATPTVDGS